MRAKRAAKPIKTIIDPAPMIHGIKASELNPESRHAAEAPAKMKKNIARAIRSTWASSVPPYQNDLSERIPRSEMDLHIEYLRKMIPTMTPAGSYRRGALTCSDIDIVVRETIADIITRLTADGYIKHTFAAGMHKFSGMVKLPGRMKHRHLDIVFTTPASYPFCMLYFTGPAKFNVLMRLKAKRKGYKLNEYGLWHGLRMVEGITTERDIFAKLDIPWREPHER
jgi:DNA polymerase/3'-5' exonuclease PolX